MRNARHGPSRRDPCTCYIILDICVCIIPTRESGPPLPARFRPIQLLPLHKRSTGGRRAGRRERSGTSWGSRIQTVVSPMLFAQLGKGVFKLIILPAGRRRAAPSRPPCPLSGAIRNLTGQPSGENSVPQRLYPHCHAHLVQIASCRCTASRFYRPMRALYSPGAIPPSGRDTEYFMAPIIQKRWRLCGCPMLSGVQVSIIQLRQIDSR